MSRIKKIIAPTDLSELSLVGVQRALEMASSDGAEVIVYHVIDHKEANPHDEGFYTESLGKWLYEDRKTFLGQFLSENFPDLVPQTRIRQEVDIGVPDKRIVEKAREEGADMIVMSTHGRSGLLHMLMGSVTEKVVRRATCPVLSIRPPKEPSLTQVAA